MPSTRKRQKDPPQLAFDRDNPYTRALLAGPAQCQQWADSARQTLKPSICSKCLAPILWVTNWKTGVTGVLDKEPSPEGNIVFVDYDTVHYLRLGDSIPGGASTPRFVSHFSTCPFAGSFKS